MIGLLCLLSWSTLRFLFNPPHSPIIVVVLALTLKLSAIPLTIGLLRFFVILTDMGQLITIVFSMTYDLWWVYFLILGMSFILFYFSNRRFGFIYLMFLLGFGISLKALFYEYEEFNSIYNLLLSMFQMSLNTFSYDTFDYDEYQYVGQLIIVVMVLSITIVLVNAIIATFVVLIY